MKIKLINEPQGFRENWFTNQSNVDLVNKINSEVDSIILFTQSQKELMVELPILSKYVGLNGEFLVFVPGKLSSIVSDLKSDLVISLAENCGLKLNGKNIYDKSWDYYIFLKNHTVTK
ncbi:MAG: hypothetical protein WCZ90_01865 [Melioribacteraceae bacterium]